MVRLLVCFLCLFATKLEAAPGFNVTTISMGSVSSSGPRLLSLLTSQGILAVSVPGLAKLRLAALDAMAACTAVQPREAALHDVSLAGGILRTTLAIDTNNGKMSPLPPLPHCPDLEVLAPPLRAAVGLAGSQILKALDVATAGSAFAELEKGHQLEHFHFYRPAAAAAAATAATTPGATTVGEVADSALQPVQPADGYTLAMHTDAGVMLAMVPALLQEGGDSTEGFLIQTKEGETVQPNLQADSVVFLVGEAAQHMSGKAGKGLRAVPHALTVKTNRSWFGKMWLPKQLLEGGEGDAGCKGDDIHCWMRCLSPSALKLNCLHSPVCVKAETGKSCKPDDMGCTLQCPTANCTSGVQPATPTAKTNWCAMGKTDMLMGGFASLASNDQQCVMLFTESLALDSGAKFAGGVVFAMALGIISELLTSFRRSQWKWATLGRPHRNAFLETVLYGAQMTLAYLLMLIAMTYQVELFVAVIFGLMLGRFFNLGTAVTEGVEPCCQGLMEEQHYLPPQQSTRSTQHPKVDLLVSNMVCVACSTQVDRALRAVEGVHKVQVELETGKAVVWGTATSSSLVQAVEAVGKTATVVSVL